MIEGPVPTVNPTDVLGGHRIVPVVVLDDPAKADALGAALVEGGLLSESLDPREGFRRFAPLRDDVSSAELLCTGCGGVTRVADDVVGPRARTLADAEGFVPVKHRLVVYGLCAGCRAERHAARAAPGGR